MDKKAATTETYHHTYLISWRSVAAGTLFAVFWYLLMLALGAGIGGSAAVELIQEREGAMELAGGVALWITITAAVSLFLGSYFAVRLSRFITSKVGMAHGMVMASIFFLLMAWGVGSGIGGAVSGLTRTAFAGASGAASITQNPMIQDSLQKAIGAAQLKSPPQEVAQGLTARLLQGNTESAKNYLAYQTGRSPSEVDAAITQLRTEFDQTMAMVGEATARGVSGAGWALFAFMAIGLIAAGLGGFVGTRSNSNLPIAKLSIDPIYRPEFAKDSV